jgi:hypothetical protein
MTDPGWSYVTGGGGGALGGSVSGATITLPSPFGKPVPKLWGRTRVKGGLIWAGVPTIDAKGVLRASFAVAFGQPAPDGNNSRIVRLWIAGALAYDGTGGSDITKLTGLKFKLYDGNETQQPDATITADKGDLTPAFRGMIYAVLTDLDLANYSGQIPDVEADVAQDFVATSPVVPWNTTNVGVGAKGGSYEWGLVDYTRNEFYAISRWGTVAWDTYDITLGKGLIYSVAPVALGVRTGERVVPVYRNSQPWAYVMDDDLSNSTRLNLVDLHTGVVLSSFGTNDGGTSSDVNGLAHPSDWNEGRGVDGADGVLFVGTSWFEVVLCTRFGTAFGFRRRFTITNQVKCITPATITTTSPLTDNPGFALPTIDYTKFSIAYAVCRDGKLYRIVATAGAATVNAFVRAEMVVIGTITTYYTTKFAYGTLAEALTQMDTTDSRLTGLSFFSIYTGPANNPYVAALAYDGSSNWFLCIFDTAWSRDYSSIQQLTGTINMEYFSLKAKVSIPTGADTSGFRQAAAQYNMRPGEMKVGYPNASGTKWYTLDVSNGEYDTFDLTTTTLVNEASPTTHYTRNFSESDIGDPVRNAVYYVNSNNSDPTKPPSAGIIKLSSADLNTLNLGVFMRSLAITTKAYTSSDITLSGLDTTFITGAIVNQSVSLLALESQIAGLFRVDIVEGGGKIKFVRKTRDAGLTIDATLIQDDIAPLEQGNPQIVQRNRDASYDLPSVVILDYLDKDNGNAIGTQSAKRTQFPIVTTDTVASLQISVPIIMQAADALYWATFAMFDMWNAATTSVFRVGPKWLKIEPGDFVQLTMNPDNNGNVATYVMKVTQAVINADYSQTLTGKTFAQFATFAAPIDAGTTIPTDTIPDTTPAVPQIIDNVQLTFANPSTAVVPYQFFAPRPVQLYDEAGSNYLGYYLGGTPQGFASTKLDAPANVWAYDTANSVTVIFKNLVALATVSDSDWLAGVNAILIGIPTRWELVYFRDVVANSDGSYTLSQLLRGMRGTEYAASSHLAGDTVIIPSGLGSFSTNQTTGNVTVSTVVIGQVGSDPTAFQTFNQTYGPLECFAPHNLTATNSAGDIVLTWNRRDRAETGLHDLDGSVVMSEATEAYEIDVYKSGAVIRTLTATSETVTYTAAMQLANTQPSPMLTIDFAVYQISAVAGRGHGTRVTADVM